MRTLQITDELAEVKKWSEGIAVREQSGAFKHAVVQFAKHVAGLLEAIVASAKPAQGNESAALIDAKSAKAQRSGGNEPARGTGLPSIGSAIDARMAGAFGSGYTWSLATVTAHSPEGNRFTASNGCYYWLSEEGQAWRRVQQAEPAQPSESAKPICYCRKAPCQCCEASIEPAGEVTTENLRKLYASRGWSVQGDDAMVTAVEADIRANTAADRATIAELRGELADIRDVVDPDGVRTEVTAAWLVEHMFTRLFRQVDVAQTAGRHHDEAREALAVALSLPSSESMNGCIAAAAKLRQQHEADAARVRELDEQLSDALATNKRQAHDIGELSRKLAEDGTAFLHAGVSPTVEAALRIGELKRGHDAARAELETVKAKLDRRTKLLGRLLDQHDYTAITDAMAELGKDEGHAG